MQQTETANLKGLAEHARLSHVHWLGAARKGGAGKYGPAYCIEGCWRVAPEARRITDANSQCGAGAMSAGVQQRWIVLGTDGRHMSLGRATPPTDMEIIGVSDALTAQGLSGWLACMQGDYYSRGKVTLAPLKRIGAAHEADWQAALAAFQHLRGLALAQADR